MLSQAAGYASTALGMIASAGGKPVLIKEIAAASSIPAPYLAKIINNLARRGIVSTQRGIGGGVTLAQSATNLTLLDVCKALDDPITQTKCMLGAAQCSDERACPGHLFWKDQRASQLAFLEKTTIADLAAFESRRRWNRPAEKTSAK